MKLSDLSAAVLLGFLLICSAHLLAQPFQQSQPLRDLELRGEVVAFDFSSPVTRIVLEVVGSDGRSSIWTAETQSAVELRRAGWTSESLVAGERVVLRGRVQDAEAGLIQLTQVERINGTVLRPGGTTALASLSPGYYSLVPGRGYIRLSFDHQGFSRAAFWFSRLDASLELSRPGLLPQNLQVTLLAEDLASNSAELERLLRSGTFFDASGFPLISYTGTRITHTDGDRYRVDGALNIKGISVPVSLTAVVNRVGPHPLTGNPALGISARGTLNRNDWGLGQFGPDVGLEVSIEVEAEFELNPGGSFTNP